MARGTGLIAVIILSAGLIAGCKPDASVSPQGQEFINTSINPSIEVQLEKNDWSSSWVENANLSGKPRILFVGDSITNGYFDETKEYLGDDYFYAYFTTSKFIANPDWGIELSTILNRFEFEIIVISNGLHGFGYTIEDYEIGLTWMVQILSDYDPNAEIIWVTSTPIRTEGNLDLLAPLNRTVLERNQAAIENAEENGYLVLDLYQKMLGHLDYYRQDGIHFNSDGQTYQGELIADYIHSISSD